MEDSQSQTPHQSAPLLREQKSDELQSVASEGEGEEQNNLRRRIPRTTGPDHGRYHEPLGLDGEPIESRDFTTVESQVYIQSVKKRPQSFARTLRVARWVLTFFVGVFTAAVGAIIAGCVKLIAEYKMDRVQEYVNSTSYGMCFLFYVGFNVALGLIGVIAVQFEPACSGSGVPEIKCTLNGMRLPKIVRFKTLIAKVVGVIPCVASGLPVGKEGPMLHIGSIIAAGLSQGKSSTIGFDTSFSKFMGFRNDVEKRDFISCGLSAGLASAFGAPLGGVLLAMEGGSSFWAQHLTWRSFFCALIATTSLSLIMTFWKVSETDTGGLPGMFTFGDFGQASQDQYYIWELPFMAILGVISGLIGALYVRLTYNITFYRKLAFKSEKRKWTETFIVLFLWAAIAFLLAFLFRDNCYEIPENDSNEHTYFQYSCADGSFNEMATLFFTPAEDSIRLIFHTTHNFNMASLIPFFCAYFVASCFVYGLPMPSGLFVPALLAGGVLGRIFGQTLEAIFSTGVSPGTYALIGAAALLTGITRMTLSLTVMMIEATGDTQYALPLMVAIMFAKFVGDAFNAGGVYEMKIRQAHLPFLEYNPAYEAEFLEARDVMDKNIVCLPAVCKVQDAIDAYLTPHSAFPVVSLTGVRHRKDKAGRKQDKPLGQIRGLILKKHLVTLLTRKEAWKQDKPQPQSWSIHDQDDEQPPITWRDLEGKYPRYPQFRDADISEDARKKWIDLSPYMHRDPLCLWTHSRVSNVYRVFRSIGLRHLVIINVHREVVGMITRKCLTRGNVKAVYKEKQSRQEQKVRGGESYNLQGPFKKTSEGYVQA